MEINAKTTYDKQTIKAFVKNVSFKSTAMKVLVVIIAVLMAIYAALTIYEIIALKIVPITYILLILLFGLYLGYIYLLLPIISYRRFERKSEITNEYTFFDDKMLILTTAKGIKGSSEYEYNAFFKVIETNDYIYLYISRGQALIVDKTTLSGGTSEQIRGTIIGKLGTKNYKFKV